MFTITSRTNPLIRTYRDLAAEPDREGTRLLLDGFHLVSEARDAGLGFESVIVDSAHVESATPAGLLARRLDAGGVRVASVSASVFRAASPVATPSGLAAIVARVPIAPASVVRPGCGLLLVLADVQDPGNLGTLLRVAEAAGVAGVLVCGSSANPFGWKAVRGSMGSILRLPVARVGAAEEAVALVHGAGGRVVGAVPREGTSPERVDWTGTVALTLGGEGAGLAPAVMARCDARVSIPMHAPVESLNVAAAGAILLYTASRVRA